MSDLYRPMKMGMVAMEGRQPGSSRQQHTQFRPAHYRAFPGSNTISCIEPGKRPPFSTLLRLPKRSLS